MNSARLVHLPLDHLEAELCAFPLASESSLGLAPTELDPVLGNTTGRLWRDAERLLFETWPAVGLDEFVALRDRLWFPEGPSETRLQPVPMAVYLRSLAERCLERRGSVAVPSILPDSGSPQGDDFETRARDAWRWLTFALPSDLLLAALADGHSAPVSVETLQPVTRTRLSDSGFAEPHLHVGAALEFPLLWVVVQWEVLQLSCKSTAFESPGASLGEGRNLCPWLQRASLARLLLAEALRSGASSFEAFLDDNAARLRERLGATGVATVAVALRELERGRLATTGSEQVNHATLRRLVRSLIRHVPRLPDHPEEVWQLDPIASLVPWHHEHTGTPETWFIMSGLRHIEGHPRDQAFARLFWQVVRVRCLLYRHLVQRPLTPGLQWFLRSFDRMRPARRSAGPRLMIESALPLCGMGKGLKSLEVRTSPDETLSETARLTRAVEAARRPESENRKERFHSPLLRKLLPHVDPPERQPEVRPEIGLVLHFPRDRGGDWKKGRPAAFWQGGHADPFPRFGNRKGSNPAGYRYSKFYLGQKKRARALSRFLTSFPGSLGVIRGLDLCADETGVPTWVLAPLLRHVRAAGEVASRKLRAYFGATVPPLRRTVHTGEDFIHLMTGLRQIDQAIDRFELRNGDRLGHALALGVDPEDWADRAGRIAMPREDRLLDLVWEWRGHARGNAAPAGRIERVRDEIAMHSERIFGQSIEPRGLTRMEDDLHDETVLRLLRFPTGPVPRAATSGVEARRDEPFVLVRRYLTSPSVFARGREIVRVETRGEKEVLKTIQDDLREKVGRRGLTVEVNPSSNLLIGHLGEMRNHPLWRLRPARDEEGLLPLSVCVGSDDPLTFATCLPEEYQLLYDALLGSGHTEAEAHRWIDEVRQHGLDARFTLPLEPNSPEIAPWLLGDGMDDVPLPP